MIVRLALVAMLFGLLGAPAVPQTAEPYTIDVIINQSGPNAYVGSLYATVFRVFEKYINAHGALNGRPVHFNLLDDQTNVQTAVQLAAQVIAKHPVVMFGGTQTAACAAVASLVKNGPVDFCISPGYFPEKGSYAFASSASLHYTIAGELKFLRLKGYRKVAVINATDATGVSSDKTLTEVFALPENRDVKVVSWQHFDPSDLNVSAQVVRIKEAAPDAIICYAGGASFGTVLRSLNDAGMHAPVITSSANINIAQLDQYKSFLPTDLYFNGLVYNARDELPKGSQRDAVDAFLDAFKASGESVTPGSGFPWDPAWITINALRKLGPSATSEQLRDYILGLHGFDGAMGTYDFRIGDQHGLTDTSLIVVKWDPVARAFPVVSKRGGEPLSGKS
jgi:branched-chain amino acid transport system substrate-binding protein